MSINIASLLDKAQVIHKLPSDYKLALVMGISHSSLTSYRQGKTLPDARVISKLCELTGDDPAVLLAQIEEKRAKTDEARTLWHMVAQRLQAGAAAAIFSVVCALGLWGFSPMEAQASAPVSHNSTPYTSWNIKMKFISRIYGFQNLYVLENPNPAAAGFGSKQRVVGSLVVGYPKTGRVSLPRMLLRVSF